MGKKNVHPKYEEALSLFKQGLSGNKVAERLGMHSGTVRTWLWNLNKASKHEKPTLKTEEEFTEILNKSQLIKIIAEENGKEVEKFTMKTFLEINSNPRFVKARDWVIKVCEDKLEYTPRGVPADLDKIEAACAKWMTEYNKQHRMNTPEYLAMVNEEEEDL